MNAVFSHSAALRRARRVSDLGYPEQLLLRAIRLWVVGYRLNNSAEDQLAKAFDVTGIEQGRQKFEEFMVAITAGASRTLGIHCVCHERIGEDEHQVLDILRFSQPASGAGECRFLLEDLLTVAALPIAAAKSQALAVAFNDAGYRLTGRRIRGVVYSSSRLPNSEEIAH